MTLSRESAFAQVNLPERNDETTQKLLRVGEIEPKLSRLYVLVDKTGFGHQHGVEARLKSGQLQIGAEQNGGQIVIDMTSFKADTDDARRYVGLEGSTDAKTQHEVNKNMLGPDVLDVQKFPTAVFKVTRIQSVKAKRPGATPQVQLSGDFTLHGTTKPLTVLADATKVNGYIRVFGSFSVLQSDFGITPFKKALGAVGVADRLTIWGELWVVDQSPAPAAAPASAP